MIQESDHPPEQRQQNRRSEDRLHDRVTALEVTAKKIQEQQLLDSGQLDRIEDQASINGAATKDLIEAFDALKGAWKVLEFIGRMAKPIGSVSIGIVTLTAAYHAAKAYLKGL